MVIPGFWHEQSRADRDQNVEIVWGNINPSMKYNFMKYSLTKITHLDAPYDTCSVMHYSGYAFSSVSPIFPIPEKRAIYSYTARYVVAQVWHTLKQQADK